jgi:hypothetical protein
MNDDQFLRQALQEYRDSSGDEGDFVDLAADIQQGILRHAQQLKERAEEEKRG